jgi:hypothetical protein
LGAWITVIAVQFRTGINWALAPRRKKGPQIWSIYLAIAIHIFAARILRIIFNAAFPRSKEQAHVGAVDDAIEVEVAIAREAAAGAGAKELGTIVLKSAPHSSILNWRELLHAQVIGVVHVVVDVVRVSA